MKYKVISFEFKNEPKDDTVSVQIEYTVNNKTHLFMDQLSKREFAAFVVRFHEGEIKFAKYIHNEYWEESE